MHGTMLDQRVFESLVQRCLPIIHEHFQDVDVQLSVASLPWFLSLYVLIVFSITHSRAQRFAGTSTVCLWSLLSVLWIASSVWDPRSYSRSGKYSISDVEN